MQAILVTDAAHYAGPGAVRALLAQGAHLVCHGVPAPDRAAIAREYPAVVFLESLDADGVADELAARGISLFGAVINVAHPNTPQAIEDIPIAAFSAAFEKIFLFPVRLTQRLLLGMKAQRAGALVFVTSARHLSPEPGFAVATSLRAGTSAFAKAVARETASFGIQVNTVEPNYLYSEMYYPRARYIDDPQGRDHIAAQVPAGRLGAPEEIGDLIAFLVSGKARFVTGQAVGFTGGWP